MTTDTKLTTPLAAELMRLRQKYIAEGGKLFTLDEIEAELGRSLATAPINAAPTEPGATPQASVVDVPTPATSEPGKTGLAPGREPAVPELLRRIIKNAPHSSYCEAPYTRARNQKPCRCRCWKVEAYAWVDAASNL